MDVATPVMTYRICGKPGCPNAYEGSESRCPDHRRQADQQHNRDRAAYRTAGHRKRFRPGVLQRDTICVLCGIAAATVADHYPKSRKELVELGLAPDDPRYGRGLCVPCHNKSTAELYGGWNNR